MHLKLIKFLLKLKAKRVIYVSCNPATCARDLDYLCHGAVSNLHLVKVVLENLFSQFSTFNKSSGVGGCRWNKIFKDVINLVACSQLTCFLTLPILNVFACWSLLKTISKFLTEFHLLLEGRILVLIVTFFLHSLGSKNSSP